MGCDFFIFKYLKITHTTGIVYIELSCERGYYCDCLDHGYDSDTNNPERYDNYINKLIEMYLTPSINPILIYTDSNYVTSRFREKYAELVTNKIDNLEKYWKDSGLLEDEQDIISIHKIEERKSTQF
jgi:ribonuclease HI